jgi:hypothetical protein
MPQHVRQPDQIVAVVGQELLRHRVAEQVRVQLYADDRTVLIAKRSHATVGQRPSFPDEDLTALDRRAGIQLRLQCASRR